MGVSPCHLEDMASSLWGPLMDWVALGTPTHGRIFIKIQKPTSNFKCH